MLLGTSAWKAREVYYHGLTFAKNGIGVEQDFASRSGLTGLFPRCEEFWKRHVCPATTRPHGFTFRPGISDIVCKIAQTSHSILVKLLDAADSLVKVHAGNLGPRHRNWRDAIEATGNALQLTTELHFAVSGNPKNAKVPSLGGLLGIAIEPFPDWEKNWKADRDLASRYRNYLVHEGLLYTVHIEATGEFLTLGRAAFAARINWKQKEASYIAHPGDWKRLETVCDEVFEETVAFIDRTYERLLDKLDGLLTNSAYQQLWGWNDTTSPPASPMRSTGPTLIMGLMTMEASSASKTVLGPHKTMTLPAQGQ